MRSENPLPRQDRPLIRRGRAVLCEKSLAVQRESISKWNGALPSTVFGGNTPTILSVPVK